MCPAPARSAIAYEFEGATGRLYQRGAAQVVFFPWPTIKAVAHSPAGQRRSRQAPHVDLRDADTQPALARYLETIPPEVVATVCRFPDHHWALLMLVARCGDEALDLLVANPGLGYMLANNQAFNRVHLTSPMVAARLLLGLGRRQREILDWLKFPASETVRRIVRKIDHSALGVASLRALRGHLAAPACRKRLAHLPRITRTVMQIAANGASPHVSPALLRQIADGAVARAASLPRLLTDTLRMWRMARPDVPLPTFHSARRIADEHHRLATGVNWTELEALQGDLPAPPLAGTDSIVPITSTAMLCDEGTAQRNCVASCAAQIRRKRLFVYRVLAPSRATLSISKRAGRWRIDQLEAADNVAAPRATRAAVQAWLRDAEAAASPATPPRPR